MLARTSLAFLVLIVGASALVVQKTEEKKGIQGPIFYMIAMSKLANKHQTRLWLSSVRQVGQWKGAIVMVTDKPECLAKNLGEQLLGGKKIEDASKPELHVYPGGEGLGKIHIVTRPETTNVKEMKRQKALAWENTRKAGLEPSFIIYTDQDIVIGQNLAAFVTEVTRMSFNPPNLAVFMDQGVSHGQLHTGIVVIFAGQAVEQCLADWGAKILTAHQSGYHGFDKEVILEKEELQGPDQKALAKTKSCMEGRKILLLNKANLLMPSKKSLQVGEKATFIHFTNTNRWKSINSESKQEYFTKTLGLPGDLEYFAYEEC